MRARAKLASHAPIHRIIMYKEISMVLFKAINIGRVNTRLSISPSNERSTISKWFCCKRKVKSIIIGVKLIIIISELVIDSGQSLSSVYKTTASC